jgi:hypothetical protein
MEIHCVPPAETLSPEEDEESLAARIAVARQKASEVGAEARPKLQIPEPLNEPEDEEEDDLLEDVVCTPIAAPAPTYGEVPLGERNRYNFDKETKAYCKSKISKYIDRELSSRLASHAFARHERRSLTPPRAPPPTPPPPPQPEPEPPSYAVARHRLSRRLDDELISGLMKTISQY